MRCYRCKQDLPIENFWISRDPKRKRGYATKCKECSRIVARKRVEKNREGYREKARRYYMNNKKKILKNRREYYIKNREKVLAKQKVQVALYKGILTRKSCEVCGDVKSEAHHFDYSKPLDVVWLCKVHHSHIHKGIKNL